MLIRNLQFAFRNFKKNKATTAINILGLAVGISASIVIFLIVRYDYSFDKWEPKKENTYRIYTDVAQWGVNPGIPTVAPPAIQKNVSGIDIMARVFEPVFWTVSVTIPNATNGQLKNFLKNDKVPFADENYFKIFPRRWLAGSPHASLSQLYQVVLSESEAKKYFPDYPLDKIIGKQMIFQDTITTVVSGVIADMQEHTDFDYNIFISLKTYEETFLGKDDMEPNWTNVNDNSKCFVVLNPKANVTSVNTQIKKLFAKNQKDAKEKDLFYGKLQPLSDVHFNTKLGGAADKTTLRNLGLLALFLLLLATINFINLSTAQSTIRAKEVGVRKTFGGNNRQIIYQFLTETFLITFCAAMLAIILSPFLIYVFKGFIPKGLSVMEMFQPTIIFFLIAIIIIVTLLAGLYPAFVLTKFKPALVMKNQTLSLGKSRNAWIREILTVSQFVLAQVFLIVVFAIGKQIHFMLNKDLGFRKDGIVSFMPSDFSKNKKFLLVNELEKIPEIQSISLNNMPPASANYNSTTVIWFNRGNKINFENVHVRRADQNYLGLFNLHLLAGKNIRIDTAAKITDVMINETLLHKMGLRNPEDAIGQYMKGGSADSAQIVGVVKDFTTQSLRNAISSTAIFADNYKGSVNISILFNPTNLSGIKRVMDRIEKEYKNIYPNKEFDYNFYDNSITKLYEADSRLSTLLKWATGLAIFVSCLGLLGLVSFMANQRTKEIGIRKVLGASVSQIITLLSKSLVKLVLLASVIAFPVAWYFSHKWLQDFAFKTTLSWWIFIISGISMLVIALTILCLRTFRAARANPVDSLRDE